MSKEILQSAAVAVPRGIMSQGIAAAGRGADGVRLRPGGPGC